MFLECKKPKSKCDKILLDGYICQLCRLYKFPDFGNTYLATLDRREKDFQKVPQGMLFSSENAIFCVIICKSKIVCSAA